jgi:hypothetical protein
MFQFILTLLATLMLIPAIVVAPESGLGHFYHSAWFWIPGGILLAAGLFGALMGLGRRRWSSLAAHLGLVLLFIGLLRETRAIDGIVTVREGETATALKVGESEKELPLGFELGLVSFQEQGYVSRVRINQGRETRIAPSHPISSHGWLILQEGFDRDTAKGWLRLLTYTGDTVRAVIGEPLEVSSLSSQGERHQMRMSFDQYGVKTRDTLFRFLLYDNDAQLLTGFISHRGVMPPSLKLGLKLIDSEVGGRYISYLRVVKRPGAGLVFFAFAVLLAGVLMFALEPRRKDET